MATASYQISHLLDKMQSHDKDFRFMATNDLMSELQKDNIKLDDESERKVVRMLLKLLEDKNGEVQNLAVKCLGPLVNKVKDFQVETIVDSLCDNMISQEEQLRDISSIGLKTVISELPVTTSSLAANICKRITGKLSTAVEKQGDVSVQLEALDILCELLARFGGLLVTFHPTILTALLPQLVSPRQAVRKRTTVALSHLTVCCNQQLYTKLIDFLLEGMASQHSDQSVIRTYVLCIASICRQAGHRFGEHIDRVMTPLLQYCNQDDDELREFCFQAFEAFVQRCPKEISPYIDTIVETCLKYISYDPNYNYDDEEMEVEHDRSSVDEDEDEEEEEDYSDDDDMSWKVRRATAKTIHAIISTRPDLLCKFYKEISPALIARFKEREDNVKSDIFQAYMSLARNTRSTSSSNSTSTVNRQSFDEISETPTTLLTEQIPQLIRAIQSQLKDKTHRTRSEVFMLLKEVCMAIPGCMADHMNVLVPGAHYSLVEKNTNSNMKIEALSFIHTLLICHPSEVFYQHLPILVAPVVLAVSDSFYKVTAEALLVLQHLVKVFRTPDVGTNPDIRIYIDETYDCVFVRLKAADLDQEVKERAISCMGQILASLGDILADRLSICLPVIIDRLRNEITRLATVRALIKVADSQLKPNISSILPEAMPILGSFLRKNQRALKLSTLTLLDTLMKNYNMAITSAQLEKVQVELPALINESDLHIAQLCLHLLTSIAKYHSQSLVDLQKPFILPEILTLAKSPLLQGGALNALLEFLESLVKAGLTGLSNKQLLKMLTSPVTQGNALHRQAYHSLAKCVAAVTVPWPAEALKVVNDIILSDDLLSPNVSDHVHIFSLLVIAEIGRHMDLSSLGNLKDVILSLFANPSEEVKQAASYALGSIAVGNLSYYLPFILHEIESQNKRQYLLLHSLKEIISSRSGVGELMEYVGAIWEQLFRHCECVEEGTRNVVAECLGKLTLIDPENLLSRLQEALKSNSPLMRTTVLTAVKFTISDQPQPIDTLLKENIGEFLSALEDEDLAVRRVALVAFNCAAHNKPSLVRDLLDTALPHLYKETAVRKELIREVEMGPFKHTVDDGLDMRKAAFECMYTLLDSCLDRLDPSTFLNHVESGLRDHYDIKMLTYLMVVRAATLIPGSVLNRLDKLVDPLRQTIVLKVKANSVKQEHEKQDELKRAAMRAVIALLALPGADRNPHLIDFMTQVRSSHDLQLILDSVQKDSAAGNSLTGATGLQHDMNMDIS